MPSVDTDKIIHDLNARFAATLPEFYKRHIVFWYDEEREFEDKLDEIVLDDDLFKHVTEKVEGLYSNWFLGQLGANWSQTSADNLAQYGRILEVPQQVDFYRDKERKDCDMVVGYIANDRMFVVLDRFFNGEITDLALIHSLSALKPGKQYVALTEKACNRIKILDEQRLSQEQRMRLKKESESNRKKGIALAEEMCKRYRREGKLFFIAIYKYA